MTGVDAPVPEEEPGVTSSPTGGSDRDASAGPAKPADDPVGSTTAPGPGAADPSPNQDQDRSEVGDGGASIEEPLDPLTVVSIERDEYLDTLRRVQADFENYKKRMIRQQTEHLDRAAEALVNKLLPALDTLELAVAHNEESTEAGKVLRQVYTALYDTLAREGLEKVDPLDREFDPNEAEAVMHEPADEGQSGHVVVEVLRPGYRWRGRVLRAAMVKVKG